jgi:hypothetical protein
MSQKRKRLQLGKHGLGSTIFLILIIWQTMPSGAVNVWSEEFEDGNYDGWTILDGSYSATTEKLIATGEKTAHHRIRHNSSVAYGTWSFDVCINQSDLISGEHMYIYFLTEIFGVLGEEKGYFLTLIPNPSWMVHPVSIILGSRTGLPSKTLGESAYAGKLSERQHFDITRNTDGHFNVFVNGSLIIEIMDNEYTVGNYFGFDSQGGHGLDNITVNNDIVEWPNSLERANLKFTEESITKTVEKEQTATVTVVVENEGEATGYGTVVIGTTPSGITVTSFGLDLVKNLKSGETKDVPLKVTTDESVKPGKYNVSIELKNSTITLDTLTLELEVPGSGTVISGFEIMSIVLILCVIAILPRKKWSKI